MTPPRLHAHARVRKRFHAHMHPTTGRSQQSSRLRCGESHCHTCVWFCAHPRGNLSTASGKPQAHSNITSALTLWYKMLYSLRSACTRRHVWYSVRMATTISVYAWRKRAGGKSASRSRGAATPSSPADTQPEAKMESWRDA